MARGARLVNAQGVVQDTRQFVLAKDGVANSVERAMIAHDGLVCQFWPPDEGEGGPNPIVMTDAEATSYDIKTPAQGQPQAKCYYDCNTGNLILSDPAGDYTIPVLAPVPRGTGQYLCKFEPVTGLFVTHFDDAAYNPDLMQYDGTTGYYTDTYTSSGNKVTTIARFKRAAFTGGGTEVLARIAGPAPGYQRTVIRLHASDHADADKAGKIQIQTNSSTNTTLALLVSPAGYIDDNLHMLVYAFDADAGTAVFRIDGVNADDVGNADRVAPTIGTLLSGAASSIGVGARAEATEKYAGQMGYFGHREAYLTNYPDFGTGVAPAELDEITWSEWGAQPEYWHSIGKMENSLGSEGVMTKNGTIVQVSAPELSWHDVLEEGNLGVFINYLPNTTSVPGQVLGEALFSVAADDGTGAPDVVTQVDKTINFIAERTGNNLIMTQDPWTLTDHQVNEVARARVDINPDGVLRGYEHDVEVRTETYALNWNSGFTVRADLVAGSVSGTALGVTLGTATPRTWEVAAGVGEDNSGTIDLTVTDGVTSVTKRIVLNASVTEETSTSDLSDDWTTFLRITDEETTYSGLPAEAGGRLIFYPDGTMDAFTYTPPTHYPTGLPGYPLNWNTSAPTVPDPENFEIMVTRLSGDAPVGPLDVWRNLSTQQEWHIDAFARADLPFETEVYEANGAFLVSIREVGRPDTVKLKTVEIIATAISNGTGISIP